MPLLKIITNVEKSKTEQQEIAKEASKIIASKTGKPERYVMVLIKSGAEMTFGGSAEPLAFCEMKSIGLKASQTAMLSDAICNFVNEKFKVEADRVYIEFAAAEGAFWGWNGATF